MSASDPVAAGASAGRLLEDPEAWDEFVAGTRDGAYPQTARWAAVKVPNGWAARRVVAGTDRGPVGLQVLVRRRPPLPWGFGYGPRGPVSADPGPAIVGPLTEALRVELGRDPLRPASVRVDPPVEANGPADPDGAMGEAFVAAGWRRVAPVQPSSTRLVDLSAPEEALWGDLRRKWRQYVNLARRAGVTVVEAEGDRLADFHRILVETAGRTGMGYRTLESYRAVWDAFRPAGMASLLFAVGPDGDPQATLFLIRCGDRVVEPYGGMTASGAASRANYLLKWEAIRRSREAGAASYDLWGLVHPGIAHFKAGFGGREVRYVGGFELPISAVGDRVVRAAIGARAMSRGGARHEDPAGGGGGDDA